MVLAVAGLLVAPGPADAQQADAGPEPTVTEVPPDAGLHGHPLWDPWFDPGAFGYETHEFLVSGTATATGADTTADYTTRITSPRRPPGSAAHR